MVSDFNLSLFRIYESECEQVTSFELRLPPGNQISNFNYSEAREVAFERLKPKQNQISDFDCLRQAGPDMSSHERDIDCSITN